MKYATVVTIAGDLEQVPHTYYVSPADAEGNPKDGKVGKFAQIQFATGNLDGCSEGDLIGVVMHRLAAKAQDGEHRECERAIQCLDAALAHLNDQLVITEVASDLEALKGADLSRLAVEAVQ